VLIIDDESADIVALTHILGREYTIYASVDGADGIETALERMPDVILLDILMPEMDGYQVLSHLKNNESTKDIPVIIISGLGSAADEEKGLDLGAADYITKPFSPAIVKLRVGNMIQMLNMMNDMKYLSETDQLTGIPNRRVFDSRLQHAWEQAKRGSSQISICVADIDNFKKYNDVHGHLQGDMALKTVARAIQQSLKRSIDVAARWGGEEFSVLLEGTDSQGALLVAESIRENVGNAIIPCHVPEAEHVTISVGVNTLAPRQDSFIADFISGADMALYAAKRGGKNKVCKWEEH
jgi:diguanylate cyclase (GGDEF)-like protein